MTLVHLPGGSSARDAVLGREIDDLLLRLRGLVLVRDLLAERGATRAEIDEHGREADRVRTRLAALIGGREEAEAA